jgi:hypothetical protein
MIRFHDVPRPALVLGVAGLLPTAGCLAAVLFGPSEWRDPAFRLGAIYAAIILSFLGGAWWGLSCARAQEPALAQLLVIAVAPSLAAWIALFFLSKISMAVTGLLFIACLAGDRRLIDLGLAPYWWFDLRWPLALGMAVLNVLIAFAA